MIHLAIVFLGLSAARAWPNALAFPDMERTAQSHALGNVAVHLQGLHALGSNPAGLAGRQAETLSQYQRVAADTDLALLSAAYPLKALSGTIAASVMTLGSRDLDGRDALGRSQGGFSSQDSMYALSAAHFIGGFKAGVSAKFFQMRLADETGSASGFDAGVSYGMDSRPLSFGAAAINLGRGPSFIAERAPLPTRYALSAAYATPKSVALIASLQYSAVDGAAELTLSGEWLIGSVLALRAKGSAGAGGVGALTDVAGGLGMQLFKAGTLDYSFQPFDASLMAAGLTGSHRMTLSFKFAAPALQSRRARAQRYDEDPFIYAP